MEGRARTGAATDVEALLDQLVRIDSRNPDLAPDSAGERAVAECVAERLHSIGMQTVITTVVGDRPNVVGILPGTADGPAVVLEAHLDTVPGAVGQDSVRLHGRRLYARGACDTKGSLAAMVAAAGVLAGEPGPRPTLIVAGLADEEYVMRGAAAFLETVPRLPPIAGVVIGEPTSLQPIRAHNGFIRVYAHARGRSVHSSKAHLGSNAVLAAARAIARLDDELGERLRHRRHPLTGPALLTATMISGGIAPNIVPDDCAVCFDRRLAPGEEPATALKEIQEVLDRLAEGGNDVELGEPLVALPGMDTPADHPFVRSVESAVHAVLGVETVAGGVTYSTDACQLSDRGGLPCVVLGPGSIDQAHTVDEWIDLDEVMAAVDVYAEIVRRAAVPGGEAS